jgi:hypothetical protein
VLLGTARGEIQLLTAHGRGAVWPELRPSADYRTPKS